MNIKIPKSFRVGGQLMTVEMPYEVEDKLGTCCVANGYVKIGKNSNGKPQTHSSCVNTFVHEAVHVILDTMGRGDLSQDEHFVCTFAGFATELLYSISEFYEQDIPDNGGDR